MPNIGPVELIFILVIALIVIGPGRLPDVGAALGKSIREFRKASSDITEAAKVDTSPLPPSAPTTPNTLTRETTPNTLTAASPPAAAAPTPEPSVPTPTAPTVPAPVGAPPAPDDRSAVPPD
jgi:TatA/E family protein of Tat protein translocase